MKDLKSIFEECCKDISDEASQKIKFLFVVGKNKAATLQECREFLGYTDDDDKKDLAKSQTFRLKVLHPLRDHLSKKLFNLTPEQVEQLWSRGEKTEEDKKRKETINNMLPKTTRKTSNKSIDLEDIIDV